MGHLVNPITYRLSKSKYWISSWNNITKKNYKLFFLEDYNIIKFYNWIKVIINWNKLNLEILPLNIIKTYKMMIINLNLLNDDNKFLINDIKSKKYKLKKYYNQSKKYIFKSFLKYKQSKRKKKYNFLKEKKKKKYILNFLRKFFYSKRKNFYKNKKYVWFNYFFWDMHNNKYYLFYNKSCRGFYRKKIFKNIWKKKSINNFNNFKYFYKYKNIYIYKNNKRLNNFIFKYKWFNLLRIPTNRWLNRLKYIKNTNYLTLDKKFIFILKNFLSFFIKKIFKVNNPIINFIDKKEVNYSTYSLYKLILWRLRVGYKIEHYAYLLHNKLKNERGIIGFKIGYAGRYKKKLRNKKFIKQFGAISPSNINSPLSYNQFILIMRYGVCGVKMSYVRKVYLSSII